MVHFADSDDSEASLKTGVSGTRRSVSSPVPLSLSPPVAVERVEDGNEWKSSRDVIETLGLDWRDSVIDLLPIVLLDCRGPVIIYELFATHNNWTLEGRPVPVRSPTLVFRGLTPL